ncbi:FAD/FMN-containing dehydrogenase [Paramicrobacterium agarici]|nr:FAD/FMN-containing dehydrogenase [Microbacterium agarici]
MSVPAPTIPHMTSSHISQDAAALSTRVSGPVLLRDDPRVADEVRGQNLSLEHSPEIVVGAETANDIVEAVRYATTHELPIHVQATGHGTHENISDGMLITTHRLNDVRVDPQTRLASIEAGARWRAVVDAAAPYGLAPITGSAPGVGVVGFLLGGGLGPLARSHGFGSDWVRSARIVTRAGELVTASTEENADLFWALRGGKAGFGIVTDVTVELAEVPSLYAGSLMFGAEHVDDMLRTWARWTRTVPDNVTSAAAIMRFPDVEQVPAPMRGATVLNVHVAVPGDAADAESIVAPLREAAPALSDDLGPMALTDVGRIHNDPEDPSPMHVSSTGHLLSRFDDDAVETLISSFGAGAESPLTIAEVRHIGGTTPAPDTAVGGRDGDYLFSALSIAPVPQHELFASATEPFLAAAAAWLAAETPVNFTGPFATEARDARSWSPEKRERLAEIKAAYAPHGLFR